MLLILLVGVIRLERTTSASRTPRATNCATPRLPFIIPDNVVKSTHVPVVQRIEQETPKL